MTTEDSELALKASVGDLAVLDHVLKEILAGEAQHAHWELEFTATGTGGAWGAAARLVITSVYTAIERLLVVFASDRHTSIAEFLKWIRDPIGDQPEEGPRMPQLLNGIPRRTTFEELESKVLASLRGGGFQASADLAVRLVAMKSLRNDCVHVRVAKVEERAYRLRAGFADSMVSLGRQDVVVVLRTFLELIQNFLVTWFPEHMLNEERSSRGRVDLMSDLPTYVHTMLSRLEASPEKAQVNASSD